MAADLYLEIIEGPGAGMRVAVDRPLVIGRARDADLVLADSQVSRHHARVSPGSGDWAIVEDLGSANGTLVDHQPIHATTRGEPGAEILLGVTVLGLRSGAGVAARPSAVRPVPAALATQEHRADVSPPPPAGRPAVELEHLRDGRVRLQARTAPLAIFALAALVVVVYLAAR